MYIILMLVGAAVAYELLRRLYLRYWNKKLTVDIGFSVSSCVCGDTVELIETVSNAKALPLPYIHLKFQAPNELRFMQEGENTAVSDMTYRNDIFSLLMNQRITRRIPVRCLKRGVYSINNIELVSTGLFLNNVSVVRIEGETNICVYPEMYDASRIEVLFNKLNGLKEQNAVNHPDIFAFRQIREYDVSDPMNTINWKASARMGSLMVNQYNETIQRAVKIILNIEPEGMLRFDRISESAISIASGLSELLLSHGISVGLLTNGVDYESGEWSVVEASAQPGQFNEINTVLARIELSKQEQSMISVIEKASANYTRDIFSEASENDIYVMIGANTRRDMQECFDKVSANSIWVVPGFDMEAKELEYTKASVIAWEVSHNAQG